MSVLFISHSSRDDRYVQSLEAWLLQSGFNRFFVDHGNIRIGDKWRIKLQEATRSCRVVLCVITNYWLQSSECFAEYSAARFLGKRIISLMLVDPLSIKDPEPQRRLAQIRSYAQFIDLTQSIVQGELDVNSIPEAADTLRVTLRAAGASEELGLDPAAFAVDRKLRPVPFPGLASYGDSDGDAAIFYGRSIEIARIADELRKQVASADLRPLVILGGSGAGKSSLLKAGLIPRLRREAPSWLPLRALRPRDNPLLQLAVAFSRTAADFGVEQPLEQIYDRLLLAWRSAERDPNTGALTASGISRLETAMECEGKSLRSGAKRPFAAILISIDQAEGLAEGDEEFADALADYLRAALHSTRSRWLLAFTIRTDSFPDFQRHKRLQNLEARGYDLRSIPVYRFADVIKQPAKRYGVDVDQRLIDQMMEDAPDDDAMPLLAFAMQRLWNEHAAGGKITLDHYRALQGLGGLLDSTAERALRGTRPGDEPSAARLNPRRLAIAEETFVPNLVDINPTGAAVGRVAAWSEFSSAQRRLLGDFEDWYLVTTFFSQTGGNTVEVAHNALFEKWERLRHWLEPERARLEAMRLLKASSFSWDRNRRRDDYLEHWQGGRLREAQGLRDSRRYGKRLDGVDRAYLAACERLASEEANRRKRRNALAALLAVIMILGGISWIKQDWIARQWKLHTRIRPFMATKIRPFAMSRQAEALLQPGQAFRECAEDVHCPDLVVIQHGQFMMGSETGRENELPVHLVTLARPLAVGKFEVTFEEWDICVVNGWCAANPDKFGRGKQPAINISWLDAQDYVRWLSEATGKQYRLLSEAEWEYVARANSATIFPWGDEVGSGHANCQACGNDFDNKKTVEVGSFQPNGFGLYDMTGNVWEWCADAAELRYDGAPVDGTARSGKPDSPRILRGGAWNSGPVNVRLTARYAAAPSSRHDDIGFRIARNLSQ
jgi:formylglycine-generating enzyme required for sulfatase activity